MNGLYLLSGYGEEGHNTAVVELTGEKAEVLRWIPAGIKPTWSEVTGTHVYILDGLRRDRHGETGRINVYRREGDDLIFQSRTDVGDNPCALAITPDGKFMAAADYISGDTYVLRILGGGDLEVYGVFPYAERNGRKSQAHSVLFSDGKLYTADLGVSKVHVQKYDAENERFIPEDDIMLPEGAGPRHVIEGPEGVLIAVGELDSRLYFLDKEEKSIISSHPTTLRRIGNAAGSAVWMNGLAYVSNRGADTIGVIDPEKGLMEEIPTAEFPRFMGRIDDTLFTLGQHDGKVEMRDASTLEKTGVFGFPFPACIRKL